jgi:hypothetical protein
MTNCGALGGKARALSGTLAERWPELSGLTNHSLQLWNLPEGTVSSFD